MEKRKSSISETNNNVHMSNQRKRKANIEISPDSEKFEKYLKEFNFYLNENKKNEKILIQILQGFLEFSKKSKYQIRILEANYLIDTIKDILINSKSNIELSSKAGEIIMNISKSEGVQVKLIIETCLNFNCLFQILLININSSIAYNLLMTFLYLTKSKEILLYLQENSNELELFNEDDNFLNFNEQKGHNNIEKLDKLMSKLKVRTIIRTLAEQILDGLTSSNKKILLEILQNLYAFDDTYITKEAIEPFVRCLGDKNTEVVTEALKILLFFTKNKAFHNDLLKDNFIFRLVRAYKQGIDEMDVLIVKILCDLFDNRNLYEILFKNNVLLMLSNYLMNFEIEKNEKYEEVIRNVFEIFKLINKNTEEENNKSGHLMVQNPLVEDENLQILIFKKAYSLAAFSKNEESILSCLSLIYTMLSKFSSTLLYSNETVKSIIELVPPFFKNKRIEIIRYSLCIFEIILNKKSEYFQQEYVSANNQNFSIKSLVYSIMNLVNDFSGNYELLRMSCRILVNLSSIVQLQVFFLQEPQITVLKVFIDNLLKTQRILKIEEKEFEEKSEEFNKNSETNVAQFSQKIKLNNNIIRNNNINFNTPKLLLNKKTSVPSPLKLGGKINTKHKMSIGRKTSGSYNINFTNSNGVISSNEENEKNYLSEIKRKIMENISLLKDCFTVISNLGKNADNLEVLRLKGFLDVITDKLWDNDTEILPYIIRCIQGFCQDQGCIDNILRNRIINKILNIYKLYRLEDEKIRKSKSDSNMELDNIIQEDKKNSQEDKKLSQWITTAKRLEVLKSLKIILESDIKLQRTFIIERGIEILLNDIINNSVGNINESVSDQLNEMILRVIYVVSCNINKLFLIYFNSGEKIMKKKDEEKFDSSSDNSDEPSEKDSKVIKLKNQDSFSSLEEDKKNQKVQELKLGDDEIKEENSDINNVNNNDDNNQNINNAINNDISKISKITKNKEVDENNSNSDNLEKDINDINNKINEIKLNELKKSEKEEEKEKEKINISQNSNANLFKVFSEQLSEEKFMDKLTEVGMNDKNNSNTYKELIKIFINLYLNRFYLEYFIQPKNFDKVIKIISTILKKYKENSLNSYEILKLIIIFLKFICEEENLIKKFLKEDVISVIISSIIENDFYNNIKEEETKQFYYNFSLVLLRLTEFNGYIEKFESFQNFFKTLEKLYDMNSINGKIYIISIIRNIIAEKQDFFEELDLARFLNKVVSQKNSLIVFEFVELIKNLVHSRSMCKRMESVFRYLINEIRLEYYSSDFKKKMLDLILCLSYENSNIQEYSLQDLLTLIKNFDINMTQKTTLLLLMNFSSLSNNFEFLMQEHKDNGGNDKKNNNTEKKNINLTKKDFIQVVNQLIDSDRFSQILIQRLLINITSIEGIDISIISKKIIKVLVEILAKSVSLQDNIIIFSLATLVNIINRNVLRFEEVKKDQNNTFTKQKDLDNPDNELDKSNGYASSVESNELLITESKSDSEQIKHKIIDFQLNDIDEEFGKKNKNGKIKKDKSIKEKTNFRSRTLGTRNNSKRITKGILRKNRIGNGTTKKAVGIRTIEEEKPKEDEENSIIKENEKEEINLNEEEYKPIPESEKEVAIVDYIIEKVPNLLEIIKGLFNKGSIDICSLSIMFCCNLIRKIRYSKHKDLEPELIKCVDDYIQTETLLNPTDNTSSLLKTGKGKFLYIAIIKYFICLSIEDIKEFLINNLQKSKIIDIIMNNIKESNSSNLKRIKQFKLTLNDIRENSINFALVENQLTLINLLLLLIKQKNIKFFFGYRSQNEIREYIDIFFEEFIKNFSDLLVNLKKDAEEQQKLNNMNKIELIKEESDDENKNKDESLDNIENKSQKKEKKELIVNDEGVISKNQTIQNILISSYKIILEYLVDFDYFNKYPEDRDKSLLSKKEINANFYNKISIHFESILNCIIEERIGLLCDELKNLLIYILYFLLTYNIDKFEGNITNYSSNTNNNKQNNAMRNSIKKNNSNNKYNDIKTKLETNLENDINVHKWLIKFFNENKYNIQNDLLCIKLFTYLIYNEKHQNIFNQDSKFLKKLLRFIEYNGENEIKNILKIESERLLNILSFNYDSHQNLYIEGIYDFFKSNLYIKIGNSKKLNKKGKNNNNEYLCNKEDFILLVNMILNNNNKDLIKDDIKKILFYVLPSKDLTNNVKFELFNIYLNIFIVNPTNTQFQEDFQIMFDLLFKDIISDFSETLFLCDKLVNSHKIFCFKFLLKDDKLNHLFDEFLKFDKIFPSKKEEFLTFIKLAEIRINKNEISEKYEKLFTKIMKFATSESFKEKLRDVNIINSLLNFSFNYFLKYSEKKNFVKIIEEDDSLNEENDDDIDLEDDKKANEDEDDDDYDESSSGDSVRYFGKNIKNKNARKEIKLRIKNELRKKLKNFIINNGYSRLIDNIIYNSFKYDDLRGISMLSMLLIQEDYKLILIPLNDIENQIFKKEFLFNLFNKFLNSKSIDVKEFSFYIHLAIVLSNVELTSTKINSIGDIISIILDIYDKFLIKFLSKTYNPSLNNENNNNNENGVTNIANGGYEGSRDNGSSQNNEDNNNPNSNLNNNLNNITNLFNDTVTSIYFFCDLVKVNDLGHNYLEKVLIFIVKIISEIKGYSTEQKEILLRYYQELLLNYQITSEEDLFNVHFNFLRKVHRDNTLNFIEHLIFGTILINTSKEILTNSIKEFLNMVTLICLKNELNFNDMDKKQLLNFYKFVKQICLVLQNKEDNDNDEEKKKENNENNNMNNGKEEDDLDTKIKIAFTTIESYFNKTNKKYSGLIKKDEDLNKKFKKLKQIIKDCTSS